MMKDRRYGGSSRVRSPSPSPRRRGFSPSRRSRIGESDYSSPRGRRFDADEDRREGRYSRRDDYRRNEDINRDYKQPDRDHERKFGRGDHHQGPSRGGTRLSGYDDAGGRDRDRDVEVGQLKRLYQPTANDGDRGRSLGRGGTRLSGYDASGGRDRDRDTEADQLKRLYDGDRGRSFGRGGTRLSGYDASGGRDRDRDTEPDQLKRLYQPTASDSDRDRSFGRGGTRISGYDASVGRDRDRETEADYPRTMYQPGGYAEDPRKTYKYGDVTSKFQLGDLRSSKGSKSNTGQWPEGSRARSEADYDYRGNKFVDDNRAGYGLDTRNNKFVDENRAGYELDTRSNKFVDDNRAGYGLGTNPLPVEADKGRFYSSSSYQMDMGAPSKSSSQVVTAGGGLSQPLSSSLHKDENLFINGRQPLDKLASDRPLATIPWPEARGGYKEDNLSLHYRPDIDMMQSSSRSKAFDVVPSRSVKADREDNLSLRYRPDIDMMQSSSRSKASDVVPSGSVKADIISSSRDFLTPAEVRLGSGTFNYTGGYNEYGSKSRAKSPVDHDGRSADFRNDSLSYLGSTKESSRDYAYPIGGQVERVGMGTRSRETYGKVVDVVEDKYVARGVPSIGTLEPVLGNAEGSSDQGYLRGNRRLEPLTMSLGPRPDYYDTHKLVEASRQEVKSHHYGSPRSPRGNDSYLDHGVSRLGELNTDRQDGISWSSYKQTDRLPPREYGSVLDNYEHRQGELISDKEKLPKPLKRTFEQRGDAEKDVNQYGGTWNDFGDAIEPWRDDMDSKYRVSSLKYAKSNFGHAKNVSNLTSQHHFHGTGSVSGPSHYKNISGHRDIKNRLGPVTQKLHVSQRLVNKYKPSLKKRLGPGPQNNDSIPPWLRKRKVPNSRRIQDALNGGFADQGGEPQEDDVTQTMPQEDVVTPTKLEPPENSEDFKQMVSNAFLKFVKQLNETPAKRRKYMEHIDAGSLKCIVCGSVSEEFGDTESLVLHAFTSQKVGVRSQHLGLHKALCALTGWKTAEPDEATWICESLSRAEHLSIREDLILWPPVVIIHNSTIGNQDKDKQVTVSVQELEEKLREMGFREKMKVHRGKPANQSVMVVQFGATFSGLQEAERLHKIYSETKHGRDDFQLVIAASGGGGGNNGDQASGGGDGGGGGNDGDQASGGGDGGDQAAAGGGGKTGGDHEETDEPSSSLANNSKKIEEVMYGYMGIAEDMHQLDFDTKRRSLVKSKREIQDIAQAPLKGYK